MHLALIIRREAPILWPFPLLAFTVPEAINTVPWSFKFTRRYIYNNNGQTDIGMTVYSGRGKVAVVINVKNHLDRFWNLSQVRLTSATDFWQPFSKTRECAVRMEPSSIPPGASGVVAIVADKSAFTSESGGLETLALQLIRDDGLVEAFVKLEPALARQ